MYNLFYLLTYYPCTVHQTKTDRTNHEPSKMRNPHKKTLFRTSLLSRRSTAKTRTWCQLGSTRRHRPNRMYRVRGRLEKGWGLSASVEWRRRHLFLRDDGQVTERKRPGGSHGRSVTQCEVYRL